MADFAECVGCGYCCRKATCSIAMSILGPWALKVRYCPFLTYRDGRWWCNLYITGDDELKAIIDHSMGMGEGCGSSAFNTCRKKIPTPEEVPP